MGDSKRDKEHLGVDTNVLVAFLDERHDDHSKCKSIEAFKVVTNPTVIHEAYHTLVFKQKWESHIARNVLKDFLDLEEVRFLNQTKATVKTGLSIGSRYALGGRDSLILANFILGGVQKMVTFDEELLALRVISEGNKRLQIVTPTSLR